MATSGTTIDAIVDPTADSEVIALDRLSYITRDRSFSGAVNLSSIGKALAYEG
jgi:hypothetical protein